MVYDHRKIKEIREVVASQANEHKQSKIRQLVLQSLTTRIRTSFVFPLAEFERVFGYLWGQEIENKASLTPDQLVFWDMYKQVRKAIFDNGNAQIRASETEINCLV